MIVDKNVNPICVFFDLKTPSFSKTSGILQIAAKCEKFEFIVYLKPSPIQKISEEASQIHGLRVVEGKLQLHRKSVITVTISEALLAFYEFLCSFGKKCILIAHNYSFDYPRLMNAIRTVYMKEHFQAIVHGFCDTLPAIKKSTEKKGRRANKLENLANEFGINSNNAHNALHDVVMLKQVLEKLEISKDELQTNAFTWTDAQNRINFLENLANNSKNLNNLNKYVSHNTRKKMVAANITYDLIINVCKSGFEEL